MKIIPFRIKPSKEEDNYSDVYAFLIQGTKKDAYEIEIEIDSLNDLGITETRCTCPHFTFRGESCKHIQKAKEILVEHGIATDTIKSTHFQPCGKDFTFKDEDLNLTIKAMCGGEDGLCDSCAVQEASK